MIEWESVEPISVTFEASDGFADWLDALKKMSITELDVVGLHDKTTGVKREFVVIDRVLEIIDGCKFKYKEDEVTAWDGILWHNRALEQAKQAVLALKGGADA